MKTTITFSPRIRRGVVHLTVLLLVSMAIPSFFPIPKMEGNYLWHDLGEFLLIVVAFFVHSLWLLPVLFKQKNLKKYLTLTFIGFLVIWFLSSWFEALHSSSITMFDDGTRPDPMFFFSQIKWFLPGILFVLAGFIPFTALSFLYFFLLISAKERKALFSPKYLEYFFNVVALMAFFFISTVSVGSDEVLFFLTIMLLSLLALFFYLNVFFFVPILCKGKATVKYLLLISFSYFSIMGGIAWFYEINLIEHGLIMTMRSISTTFFLVFLLSLIYGYVRIKRKTNEQLFNLRLGAKESELSLLKSQVNPHFLFNTLNTLYATALEEKADKTAESTAKLGNLLRYMQNDIQKNFIPLENEIQYLKDYITIQELRCEIPPEVETRFENIGNKRISPGLLIPFVENAFKYGINPGKTSRLSLSVICSKDSIYFECINSYDDDHRAYHKEQGFGIGIKNTRERLKLVYPESHTLAIAEENNTYTVKLSITPAKE